MRWLARLVVALIVLLAGSAAAETGVSDTEIVLGCSTSLSGPLAFPGEQASKFGLELSFRALNDAGGIHGRKVRVLYADDGLRSGDALANVKKLVEQDRVFAMIAPLGTAPVTAMLPYVETHGVPLLFPAQGSPITRGRHWVFGGMMLYDRQARMMVDYLVGPRRYRSFAVLHEDDDYGRSFLAWLEKDLGRHGRRIVAAEAMGQGPNGVSAAVAKVRAARPQVTFLVLRPATSAQVLKERERLAWRDSVMVTAGPLTDERYLALAADAAEGVEGLAQWPDPFTSELPGVKHYREDMRKYFPRNEPNRYSLSGYFAALLFSEGARRAGRALTRESLVAGLESLEGFESGIVPPLAIGRDHETQKQGYWVRMERGRFKTVTDWFPAGSGAP